MDPISLPQTLFTVGDLASLGGLVVAVYVIVSFLKDPLKLFAKWLTKGQEGDWIVRPATVFVALVILLWLMFIQGDVTAETVGLAFINAFLVALIAGAAHDYIVAPTKSKINTSNITDIAEPLIQSQVTDINISNPQTDTLATVKTIPTADVPPPEPPGAQA